MVGTQQKLRHVAAQLNQLLRDLRAVRLDINRAQTDMETQLQAVRDQFTPKIDRLVEQRDNLVVEIIKLALPHFDQLTYDATRQIKLRNGQIWLRDAPPALVVRDKTDLIIKRIARLGGKRRFVELKPQLKKSALKADPKFVARVKGLDIVQTTRLHIQPVRDQGEPIVRDIDPSSIPIKSQES